jgi:DNA primase
MVSQEKVAEVREANNIAEVIGEYIPLKKVGKNFRASCPFHQESAPSFYVSPEKGLYHCFGCGKSGNVFTFLMEYKGMSFIEALKFLGQRAGVVVEERPKASRYWNLYQANEFTSKVYNHTLYKSDGRPGQAYFEARGLSDSTIKSFELGYSPTSGKALLKHLEKKNEIKEDTLERLGLLVKDASGKYYDSFRGKIIFPIRDAYGKVIAFGSRVVDNRIPKYINSPESPIYKKGNSLYGLYEAKNEIRKCGEAVIVEGYMDLLTLYEAGLKNVVATLGTSLTQEQAKLISRYTHKVTLAYDADPGGIKATLRGIDILIEIGLDVKIAGLPQGYDPDSFVRKNSIEKLRHLLKTAKDFVDFKVTTFASSQAEKTNAVENKIQLAKEMQVTLSKIKDPINRSIWADKAAQILRIEKELLLTEPPKVEPPKRVSHEGQEKLEMELLALASKDKDILELVKNYLNPADFNAKLRNIAALVFENVSSPDVLNAIDTDGLRQIFTEIIFSEASDVDKKSRAPETDYKKWAEDNIKRMKELKIAERMREHRQMLKERPEESENILREIEDLAREKELLNRRSLWM